MLATTAMKGRDESTRIDCSFIRLFFPVPREECVAASLAEFFASIIGNQIFELRPNTSMDDLVKWARWSSLTKVEFLLALEQQIGQELDDLGHDFGEITFREFVQHVSRKLSPEIHRPVRRR